MLGAFRSHIDPLIRIEAWDDAAALAERLSVAIRILLGQGVVPDLTQRVDAFIASMRERLGDGR